ncbi:MAG: thiamine diphosphokinase [Desulfotomaculum sp.]|nr:thiamine diphosphokinase [Desulfotomaculum sp.]
MAVVILSAGIIRDYRQFKNIFANKPVVICADDGVRHARAMGITPDLIIGDMDSVKPAMLQYYQNLGTNIRRYSSEKDQVDTELAMQEAIKLGHQEIILLGATGDRLDHTLANIHLLLPAANLGVRATILDERNHLSLITAKLPAQLQGDAGDFVSLLPIAGEVTGVFSQGLKWELIDHSFNIGNPFGISNELTGNYAEISVKQGNLLLIAVQKQD